MSEIPLPNNFRGTKLHSVVIDEMTPISKDLWDNVKTNVLNEEFDITPKKTLTSSK